MITLTAFLLCSVVLSYRRWMIHYQLTAFVVRFADALNYAENAAIASQSTIVFGPKNANWQRGQVIFEKHTSRLLLALPPIPTEYRLIWASTLGESQSLQFRSNGFTRGQQGSFFIRLVAHKHISARLIILRTGRVRVVMSNQ